VANAAETRAKVLRWAEIVEDKAARSMVNELSRNTPKITGRLERARRRRDTVRGDVFVSTVTQPGGPGEPDNLPNWLDEGLQFVIKPKRPGGLLRFKVGARVVYARSVLWNRTRRSRRFWSDVMTESTWASKLRDAARSTTV